MRLRARPFIHYAPVAGGVYLSGPATELALAGPPALFDVVDTCVPLLEDGTTEDELVAALGTERVRPAVRAVTAAMRGKGMLLDLEALTVAEPTDDVRAAHPEALAHLEAFSDDPYADLERVRRTAVRAVGRPDALAPALRGLRRAGFPAVGGPSLGPVVALVGDDRTLDAVAAPAALEGVAVLPVWLGERATLVGPVLPAGTTLLAWRRARDRALVWAQRTGTRPAPRRLADALAGALAAQLAFEHVAGTGGAGDAYVVHGEDADVDRVRMPGLLHPDAPATSCTLQDAGTVPDAASAAATVERLAPLTAPWTGVLRTVDDADLPQLGGAVRVVQRVRDGRLVRAVGPDQPQAWLAAVLGALRCAGAGGTAAGPDRRRWLLDGALRWLATPAARDGAGGLTTTVAPSSAPTLRGRLHRPDGLPWVLAEVLLTVDGTVLAQAWGRTDREALSRAVSVARDRAQAGRGVHRPRAPWGPSTDVLLVATADELDALTVAVLGHLDARGLRLSGEPVDVDPVLGPVPVVVGTVSVSATVAAPLVPQRVPA